MSNINIEISSKKHNLEWQITIDKSKLSEIIRARDEGKSVAIDDVEDGGILSIPAKQFKDCTIVNMPPEQKEEKEDIKPTELDEPEFRNVMTVLSFLFNVALTIIILIHIFNDDRHYGT